MNRTIIGKVLIGVGIVWAVVLFLSFDGELLNAQSYSQDWEVAAGEWVGYLSFIPFLVVGMVLIKKPSNPRGEQRSVTK